MIYRLLMGVALLVAAVTFFFFFWGLSDGTVDAANILLWLPLIAAAGGIPFAAARLRAAGHEAAAIGLLVLPAFPAFFFALFAIVIMVAPPRWN